MIRIRLARSLTILTEYYTLKAVKDALSDDAYLVGEMLIPLYQFVEVSQQTHRRNHVQQRQR